MTENTTINIDLEALPPPDIVENRTFQAIYQELLQVFAALDPEYALFLHSDPVVKVIQAFAYREYLLRGRINQAALSNLLAFANGADLDQLASFYGVTRLDGEADAALRERVRLRIIGFSAAGPSAGYKFYATTASSKVRDANISSPAPGIVQVAILSTEGDGGATQELIDEVQSVVSADNVRVLTDTVNVVSATIKPIDVIADVWLDPDTPIEVLDQVAVNFVTNFDEHRALGQDITLSWIISQLHVTGVHRVVVDFFDEQVMVGPDECAALRNFQFNYQGRDF